MSNIYVYHTHIEVQPYELGSQHSLETCCSVWVEGEYRYDNIGYHYEVDTKTLYLPRGMSLPWLEELFDATVVFKDDYYPYDRLSDVIINTEPRDIIQEKSVNFLTGGKGYKHTKKCSQLALTLNTGDGKTFCTIYSILKLKMKALIITHVDNIRDQWYNAFLKFTNIKEDRMFNIVGSSTIQSILKGEVDADIYFINHKTILSYAQANGWESVGDFIKKLKIGIKVYDEAHLCFRNILRTDMFSNVYKTFYLSATFDRSDDKESRIFKKAFANTERFGRGCDGYVDRDKNIIYVPLLYRSEMNERDQAKCMTNYGFSFNRYLDIMLSEYNDKLLNMVLYAIHLCNKIEGRVLITTSTVESIKIFKELINKYVGKTKYVGLYYSGLSSEEKEDVINNADIIISTIRGNGTGSDIKRLRAIINIESFSSPIIANQLAGRLRPYGNEDSYLFDIVDLSHNSLNNQYKSRLKQMKLKCKDIRALKVKYVYNPFIED